MLWFHCCDALQGPMIYACNHLGAACSKPSPSKTVQSSSPPWVIVARIFMKKCASTWSGLWITFIFLEIARVWLLMIPDCDSCSCDFWRGVWTHAFVRDSRNSIFFCTTAHSRRTCSDAPRLSSAYFTPKKTRVYSRFKIHTLLILTI